MIYAFIVFLSLTIIFLAPTVIWIGKQTNKWAGENIKLSHLWTKEPDGEAFLVWGAIALVGLSLFWAPFCVFFNYVVSPLISRTLAGSFGGVHRPGLDPKLDHLSYFTGLLAYVCLWLWFYRLRVKLHQRWKKKQLAGEKKSKPSKLPKAKAIK